MRSAEPTRRFVDRSRRRKDRLAKDLDSALNEENYTAIQPSNASVHMRYQYLQSIIIVNLGRVRNNTSTISNLYSIGRCISNL